ncbi:TPA: hypothetical protein O8L40_000738 [Enterobacter cloacae]|nr:hypothetical protein [Enterobacter cloacae]
MTKVKAKVTRFNIILDGELVNEHEHSNNALVTRTKLIIPKNRNAVEAFKGWPYDHELEFVCEPGGLYDFYMVDETTTQYIFS